jgi:hypothetical protein
MLKQYALRGNKHKRSESKALLVHTHPSDGGPGWLPESLACELLALKGSLARFRFWPFSAQRRSNGVLQFIKIHALPRSARSRTRPHFVRARPSGVVWIFDRHYPLICHHGPIGYVRLRLRRRFAPSRQSSPVVRITASETSDQRSHLRGRDGQCGSPPLLSACLRRVSARPIRRSRHPRRSKAFPSLVRLGLATGACLGRLFPRVNRTDWSNAPTGVSAHRGSRECPCNGGRASRFDAEISEYLLVFGDRVRRGAAMH